ncbi:GDSL-type esterase/lipase family protein [Haliscomenobacter hydrossis]|uniref:Lipolytic protein G-D-S-L family n=1 Tax=Haliscomenobacter hydrossis (strain ATCC 27775 / DSM 1100 / LMG 10767 / O) TaxID=760192 RepID=F4L450_HALH1|nr:GDSL-type esterase/lipase family protein [Haliscomenobacter hydrossis]AEE50748.1 lipolytic protein G-D-S-L family [Haliscomenobacter hydrossis DSM 1100]
MSRKFKIFLYGLTCVNLIFVSIIAIKLLNRYYKREWIVIHADMMESISPSKVYFIGDSQMDNLCGLKQDAKKIRCITAPGISILQLKELLEKGNRKVSPSKVFILLGINDLRSGSTVEHALKSYESMLQTCQKKFPQSTCYLISLLPIIESVPINNGLKNASIVKFNHGVKGFAQTKGIYYLPIYELISRGDSLPMEYTFDGLHLNSLGNTLLYQAIYGFANF